MKLRLTDMAIKKLPSPSKGQVTHWDELAPGFGVRCSVKSKSFVVMYGEKRQLKTLGRYPKLSLSDARAQARRFVVQIEDGAFSPEEPSISFDAATARFLKDCEGRNKPRTVADYKRLLKKYFKFSGTLDKISRQQIMKVVSGLSKTPSEQSHAYVAIRTMMNWCVRHGLLEQSNVPHLKQRTATRDRVLDEAELCEVYRRAGDVGYPFGPIVQLLILTGQRRSEVGSLRRSWIESGQVTLPVGFAKNKREHRFPLSRMAQQIIGELPDTGDLLFPAATDLEKPFVTWAWHKARLDRILEGVAPYTLHDLRRTFATNHARISTPIQVTEKLLNHVSGTVSGITAIYNRHNYMDEMRSAIEAHDAYLTGLLDE